MALLPPIVYRKMQSVFTMYEKGELKGQKPRRMEGVTLQKALEGKLAAKLPQFKIFQGLDVSLSCNSNPCTATPVQRTVYNSVMHPWDKSKCPDYWVCLISEGKASYSEWPEYRRRPD